MARGVVYCRVGDCTVARGVAYCLGEGGVFMRGEWKDSSGVVLSRSNEWSGESSTIIGCCSRDLDCSRDSRMLFSSIDLSLNSASSFSKCRVRRGEPSFRGSWSKRDISTRN